jgi:hypothetical protein
MNDNYTPGQDCQCHAHSEAECGCDVDWTPREIYELREQVKHLQSKIEGMGYRHSHLRCQIIQAENVTLRVKSRLQSVTEQRDKLAETLEMVRDADEDCHKDGLTTIPKAARHRIDMALAAVKGGKP